MGRDALREIARSWFHAELAKDAKKSEGGFFAFVSLVKTGTVSSLFPIWQTDLRVFFAACGFAGTFMSTN